MRPVVEFASGDCGYDHRNCSPTRSIPAEVEEHTIDKKKDGNIIEESEGKMGLAAERSRGQVSPAIIALY
jgi:hypothetical protein